MRLEILLQRLGIQSGRSRIVLASLLFFLVAGLLSTPFYHSRSSSHFPEEDYTYPAAPHHGAITQDRPKRVAIIGAGASGSAAAFFLKRAGRIMEQRIGVPEGRLLGEIVVFDREEYVGGRKWILKECLMFKKLNKARRQYYRLSAF